MFISSGQLQPPSGLSLPGLAVNCMAHPKISQCLNSVIVVSHSQMSSSIEKKEKGILPSSNPSPTPAPKSQQRKNKNVWIILICFLVFRATYSHFWHATDKAPWSPSNNCPQADVLIPEKNGEIWTEVNDKIGSAAFKQTAIDWLAGAVRIP